MIDLDRITSSQNFPLGRHTHRHTDTQIDTQVFHFDRQNGILLMVTYNPFLCHLGRTKRKNLFLLYQDEEVKRVFTLAPFVSFGTAKTLRTHLMKAIVYPAEERYVRSRKYLRNRCQICKNVVETETFQSL